MRDRHRSVWWGAHYWARELGKLGHTVRLMAAQFVNPYRKSGKNDANDAEAIRDAVGRPNMRFVAAKTEEQQAVLMWHRARTLAVTNRTAQVNQIRGLLGEFGCIVSRGIRPLRRELPTLGGLVTHYVLFILDLASRTVKIASITPHPHEAWMVQVARNLTDAEEPFLRRTRFLIMERFVRSVKSECTERMVFVSRSSLERALTHYVAHYHEERNHQGLQNRLLKCSDGSINLGGRVARRDRLGGMLSFYFREAA